jgi:ComF family protein
MIPKEWTRLYNKLLSALRQRPSSDQVIAAARVLGQKLRIPHRCALCDSHNPDRICQHCIAQFFHSPHYHCSVCALPLHHSALLCGECLRHTPEFDHAYSPFLYEKPLSNLVINFKEQGDFFAGKGLATIFCQYVHTHFVQQHQPAPDLITAIPLHWKKQGKRGFNQSAFFAHYLSKQMNIALFSHVKRMESSPPQKSLDRKKRLSSLRNSFVVTRPLNNEHVVIVDDVMTTGATVSALTIALKKAGAGKVSVWVLARVPKGN